MAARHVLRTPWNISPVRGTGGSFSPYMTLCYIEINSMPFYRRKDNYLFSFGTYYKVQAGLFNTYSQFHTFQ